MWSVPQVTIAKLRSVFAIHGLPEQVVTDNGSGFTSTEFQQFLSNNGVKQTFTSPYHPMDWQREQFRRSNLLLLSWRVLWI